MAVAKMTAEIKTEVGQLVGKVSEWLSSPSIDDWQFRDLDSLAILLDVDGTLLDLAPTPREVWAPHSLRETLDRLWKRTGGALAFVSGRPISELDLIFSPLQLPAIGGHGAEMRIGSGGDADIRPAQPLDVELKRKIATVAEIGPGVLVEDKGYSLALHYRLAPEAEAAVRASVAAICANVPADTIEMLPGKLMVEIKQVGFSKGTAVAALMSHPPFQGRRPLFIGDDVTDESVIAVMPEFNGIAFSVGNTVRGTAGRFDTPEDVRTWLRQLAAFEHGS
jgi:trehalose 6-phosphate phosphatase